jgi:hypothetical protein
MNLYVSKRDAHSDNNVEITFSLYVNVTNSESVNWQVIICTITKPNISSAHIPLCTTSAPHSLALPTYYMNERQEMAQRNSEPEGATCDPFGKSTTRMQHIIMRQYHRRNKQLHIRSSTQGI